MLTATMPSSAHHTGTATALRAFTTQAAPASSLGHRTFPINPTTERSPREPSRPRPRGYDEPDLRNNVPRTLHLQQTSPEREARGTFVFVGDEEITCPRRSPCE